MNNSDSNNRINPSKRASLMRERLDAVKCLAASCRLCPRDCGVNRLEGELGVCKTGYGPVYSSANLHFGEEPPISGFGGSGTIFLTGCNLRCIFCQNYPISQLRNGNSVSIDYLSNRMLYLQNSGAHNINLVTPAHQAAVLYEVILKAYDNGLHIPIVYNSNGYDSVEMLKLWDGIIDVYMPDAKYGDDDSALECSNAPDYVKYNRAALLEMHRQVGVLQLDENGVACRGLLIRHLVLPAGLASTGDVLDWISNDLSPRTCISLMSQYFPAWNAVTHPVLKRILTVGEYREAVEALERNCLDNGWTQPYRG